MSASNESTRPAKRQCLASVNENTPQPQQQRVKPTLPTMATETILQITSYLPESSRASLALTSRALLTHLGTGVLRIDKDNPEKYALLELLEKDGRYPEHILCSDCKVFHRPAVTFALVSASPLGRYAGCRMATPRQFPEKPCHATCWATRCVISPDMVAACLRSHRLKNNIYGPLIFATNEFYGHPNLARTSVLRLADARICQLQPGGPPTIVLRTQWRLSTGFPAGPQALAAAPSLRLILQANPHLESLCPHHPWNRTYDFITQSAPNDPVLSGPRHTCLWRHPIHCSTPSCGWVPAALTTRWSCALCRTDWAASRVDELIGNANVRIVVITTWQSLGDGSARSDGDWIARLGATLPATRRRRIDYGMVRVAFERAGGLVTTQRHLS